ncbi:MAG: ParB/RepB/Spo0J family partition protein [Chloroflexota bacterium]|nr:ParB/RepB/Spo0J family partition protein [Chloroflexota bacterium]
MKTNQTLQDIPVGAVLVNPDQPRSTFSQDSLDSLARSISDSGLLYPITVEGPHEPTDEIDKEFYLLIDGERRLRAVRQLGHKTIQALVQDPVEITRDKRALLALVANLQRDDLDPIEEARAFKKLQDELGLSVAKIARRTGCSSTRINARLQLLDLEEEIQDLVSCGKLQKDKRLTESLLTIRDSERRIRLAQSLAERGATVKAGIEACKRLKRHIRSEEITNNQTPSVRIAAIEAGPMPLPKYDAFVAAGSVPEWSLVKESAKNTCDNCALRSIASDVVCRECPLVDFLVGITRTVNKRVK